MKRYIRTFMLSTIALTPVAGASAQTVQIGDAATLNIGSGPSSASNTITLGTSGSLGYVSSMPMSLNYGSVGVNVSFTGVAGVAGSSEYWNPGTTDFFRTGANNSGQITFEFTKAQKFFGMQWGSPDVGNIIQFYNGSTLVASTNSTDFTSLGATFTPKGAYAEFTFSDLGFDRVVTYATAYRWEYSDVSFRESVDPAPIPIGGLGGLIVCIGMLGVGRRRGRWKSASLNAISARKMQMRIA